MKKHFFLAAFIVGLIFTGPAFAQSDEASRSVGFTEATINSMKLDSYHSKDVFHGGIDVDTINIDRLDKLSGRFRISFDSDFSRTNEFGGNIFSDIKVHLNFHAEGAERPFEDIIFNARIALTGMEQSDLYLKLQQLDIGVKGLADKDAADFAYFKEQLNTVVNQLKGRWIHIPIETLSSQLGQNETTAQLAAQQNLQKNLKTKGLKEALRIFIEDITSGIDNEGMTQEESKQLKQMLDELFSAKLFNYKIIENGPREGYTSFRLDRGAVSNLIKKIANINNESISAADMMGINGFLSKFSLGGAWHVNSEHEVIDELEVRMSLAEIGELKSLQLNLNSSTSRINEIAPIKKPSKSTNLETVISEIFMGMNASPPMIEEPLSEDSGL